MGGELGGRRRAARPRRPPLRRPATRSTAIRHEGPHFKVDAIHLCEPSPQRTPVLFQAGASKRGRDFAARHAECVFINGPSKKVIGNIVADMRRRAAAAGRDPADLVIFTMMTVITDPHREAALEKYQDYLNVRRPRKARWR